MSATENKVNIFWFRRDLRLEDNTGLSYALADSLPVLPVFVFDVNILDKLDDKSDARVQFILDSLRKIDDTLKARNSSLKIFHSTPEQAFKELATQFSINAVFTNRDYEPYALRRDESVGKLLRELGIKFFTFKDQVIFEKSELLNEQNQPYKVFTPYKNKWVAKYQELKVDKQSDRSSVDNYLKISPLHFPSLSELGFSYSPIQIPPLILDLTLIEEYDKTRNFPAVDGTSRLGIHLRHGTLSVRKAVTIARQLNETWLNELVWREFYQMILFHFPQVVTESFKPQYDQISWRNNEEEFLRWCEGSTGYPIVDAGMRELNATGFMHNRVRMITASFLSKHLLIDWRWGEAYFAKKLLDYELASNNGGWQWAAGTGTDAQPYFRVFNPSAQTEKFDPEKTYIKKWVPEYQAKNYPKPIVEHKFARQRAIDTYKKALG